MKIKTKLTIKVFIFLIALIIVGGSGIYSSRQIYKNHQLNDKISQLLTIQNRILTLSTETLFIDDVRELSDIRTQIEELKIDFHKTLAFIENQHFAFNQNSLLEHQKKLESVSGEIIKIHALKLNQLATFKANYPIEKTQRKDFRKFVFNLENENATKLMGDVQYYSKETLYQHRDQEHLDSWLQKIDLLIKELSLINEIQTEDYNIVKNKINDYKKTAKAMGDIAIKAREIELQEQALIRQLKDIIQQSEVSNNLLKGQIFEISEELVSSIFITQATLFIVLAGISLLLSYLISQSVSKSLSQLKKGVDSVSKGDLNTKVLVSSNDEFNGLADSFNAMTRELHQAKTSLEETNQTLESRVEERTKKLSIAISEIRETNEQLQNLSKKLSKYLSPQVYQSIFTGKKDVKLESYRKRLTVFFSDIKGFTNITDYMESEALTSLLNHYLNEMSAIALKYGGTIDKYIGDAIMVFFGDPDSKGLEQDALNCVSMAIAMREKMKELRSYWNEKGIDEGLEIRMGINTGYCTVGNFGSESRLDYTIIGGQVNLASRLESNARPSQILISHETYSLIKDKICCKKMDKISVKGIAQPVQTYEVESFKTKEDIAKNLFTHSAKGFQIKIDWNNAQTNQVETTLRNVLKRFESQSVKHGA